MAIKIFQWGQFQGRVHCNPCIGEFNLNIVLSHAWYKGLILYTNTLSDPY